MEIPSKTNSNFNSDKSFGSQSMSQTTTNPLARTPQDRRNVDLSDKIFGWGADLDKADRPGVPMDKSPYISSDALYPHITRQVAHSKIFVSTDHGQTPPVFGSTCPPRGLSGSLRAKAYTLNESQKSRWLMLVLADRVDMVEGIFRDLSRGKIPNLWKEMGLSSELKHNRKNFTKKVAITAGVTLGIYLILRSRRKSRRLES